MDQDHEHSKVLCSYRSIELVKGASSFNYYGCYSKTLFRESSLGEKLVWDKIRRQASSLCKPHGVVQSGFLYRYVMGFSRFASLMFFFVLFCLYFCFLGGSAILLFSLYSSSSYLYIGLSSSEDLIFHRAQWLHLSNVVHPTWLEKGFNCCCWCQVFVCFPLSASSNSQFTYIFLVAFPFFNLPGMLFLHCFCMLFSFSFSFIIYVFED